MYEDLVEPKLNVVAGFAWETWRREPCVCVDCLRDSRRLRLTALRRRRFLPSYCHSAIYAFPAVNMQEMKIGGKTFSYTDDHSKWGLSLDRCVGCTPLSLF